ncbi:MAG: hypothetical protein P8R54_33780 [Myxococcota bacterium]|nr:hypothetical protein [Myxococcota bacterium]
MFDARVFSTLWAIAVLFHYIKVGGQWSSTPATSLLIVLCAAALLCRPASLRLLISLSLLQIVNAAWKFLVLEQLQVSWFFTLLISTVLLRAIYTGREVWAEHAGPSLRAALLVLYFYAVLHKLNAGYFSADNRWPHQIMEAAPIIGPLYQGLGLEAYGAALSVGVEAMIFLALLLPALRPAGAILSFLLHSTLGYAGFTQFYLTFPLLLSFLPPAATRLPTAADLPAPARTVLLVLALLVMPVLAGLNSEIPGFTLLSKGLWLVTILPVVVILLRSLRTPGAVPRRPRLAELVLPGALAVWCFFPYLGLVMHPCGAMYSNLSVHSGQSNHFLLPASLQLDILHGELVEITASNWRRYPLHARVSERGLRHSLVTERQGGRTVDLRYRRGDEIITITDSVLEEESVWDHLPVITYNFPTSSSDFIVVAQHPGAPPGLDRRAEAVAHPAPTAAESPPASSRSPETQ